MITAERYQKLSEKFQIFQYWLPWSSASYPLSFVKMLLSDKSPFARYDGYRGMSGSDRSDISGTLPELLLEPFSARVDGVMVEGFR